jgi:hypothetical protein
MPNLLAFNEIFGSHRAIAGLKHMGNCYQKGKNLSSQKWVQTNGH